MRCLSRLDADGSRLVSTSHPLVPTQAAHVDSVEHASHVSSHVFKKVVDGGLFRSPNWTDQNTSATTLPVGMVEGNRC